MIGPFGWFLPSFRGRGDARSGPAKTVEIPGHGAMVADNSVDLTGATCLRTNLVTKRALDAALPGSVIEIVSDNLSSVETIPFMLAGHNCVHLGTLHLESGWKIYARKGAGEGACDGPDDEGGKAR